MHFKEPCGGNPLLLCPLTREVKGQDQLQTAGSLSHLNPGFDFVWWSLSKYQIIDHLAPLQVVTLCVISTDLTSIVSSNHQSGIHVPIQPAASQYFSSIDPGMSDASSMMSSLGSSSSRHSGQHQFQDTFPGSRTHVEQTGDCVRHLQLDVPLVSLLCFY